MSAKSNKEMEQDKRNRAYDLRLRGWSYRQIGAEMGVSHVTAMRWVTDYMADVTLPLVDEVRKQEVDRMQRYLKVLEERIEDGDDKAVSLALKVSERLCKMLGVDMPTQIQVEKTETTQVDLALQDLIARQKAQNALRLQEAEARRSASEQASDEADRMALDTESDVERIVLEN